MRSYQFYIFGETCQHIDQELNAGVGISQRASRLDSNIFTVVGKRREYEIA